MGKITYFLVTTLVLVACIGGSVLAAGQRLPGDINKDGTVGITDLSMLLSSYGKTTKKCVNNHRYRCDINRDGVVNITDLSILLSNYGKTSN